ALPIGPTPAIALAASARRKRTASGPIKGRFLTRRRQLFVALLICVLWHGTARSRSRPLRLQVGHLVCSARAVCLVRSYSRGGAQHRSSAAPGRSNRNAAKRQRGERGPHDAYHSGEHHMTPDDRQHDQNHVREKNRGRRMIGPIGACPPWNVEIAD